jgi:hypothetical protein
MGNLAGSTQGLSSIAIGDRAAESTQSDNSIAIGTYSGNGGQSSNAIAIGTQAGTIQSENAIAIGTNAGLAQGANAIAIGNQAGVAGQSYNSIVINASGLAVSALDPGLFIAPINNQTAGNVLYYDPVAYQVTYGAYLNQLPVYGNVAVRDSSIPFPTTGLMVFVTGVGMQVYGATQWNTVAGTGS